MSYSFGSFLLSLISFFNESLISCGTAYSSLPIFVWKESGMYVCALYLESIANLFGVDHGGELIQRPNAKDEFVIRITNHTVFVKHTFNTLLFPLPI